MTRIEIQRRKIASSISYRSCLPPSKLHKPTARTKLVRKLRPARPQRKKAPMRTPPPMASNGAALKNLHSSIAGQKRRDLQDRFNGTIKKQCNSMMFKNSVCSYLMLLNNHLSKMVHTGSLLNCIKEKRGTMSNV